MVGGRDCVPYRHSHQNLRSLSFGPSGSDPTPEPLLERPEGSLDHRASSIPTAELPSVLALVKQHMAPRGGPSRIDPLDVPTQIDHRPSSAVGDGLSVLSREVALVQRHVPQGNGAGNLFEKSGEFGDVVGAGIGDVSREKEGELGPRRHESVEFHEDLVEPSGEASGDPTLVAMGGEAGAIPGDVLVGVSQVSGEGGDQTLQIRDRNTVDERRRGRGSGDPSEPQLAGELREGSEGRVNLVIRPPLEGPQEEEADHIAGVGRRSTRSARGTYRERGWQFANESGESA